MPNKAIMNRTIHTIFGRTSFGFEYVEWPVKSFFSKDAANEHMRKASEKALSWKGLQDPPHGWNEYDKNMRTPDSGEVIEYYLIETEIGDA